MLRKHALGVAALVGLAAVAGTFAATRTMSLGASVKPAGADVELVRRERRLDAVEASIARAKSDRPPALPPLRVPPAAVAPAAASATRIVYRRPAPIRVVAGSAGGRENEQEAENESDDD